MNITSIGRSDGSEHQVPAVTVFEFGPRMMSISTEVRNEDVAHNGVDYSFHTLFNRSSAYDRASELGWFASGQQQLNIKSSVQPNGPDSFIVTYIVEPASMPKENPPDLEITRDLLEEGSRIAAKILQQTPNVITKNSATLQLPALDRAYLSRSLINLPPGIYDESLQSRGAVMMEIERNVVPIVFRSALGSHLQLLKNGTLKFLVLEGMPQDPALPQPPLDGKSPMDKRSFVSEGMALAIAKFLGNASLMRHEQHEALVHQIAPRPSERHTQSNAGTDALRHHQDTGPQDLMPDVPYGHFMPDYLILTGLMESPVGGTVTYLAPVDDAIALLDPTIITVLSQKRFITDPPDSFKRGGLSADNLPQHAIIQRYKHQFETVFDSSSNVRPADANDAEAQAALDAFVAAVDKVKQGVVIKPGMVVAFRNRQIIHARGPVLVDNFDAEQRRWLQRVYVYDFDRAFEAAGALTTDKREVTMHLGPGMIAFSPRDPANRDALRLPPRIADLAGLAHDARPVETRFLLKE